MGIKIHYCNVDSGLRGELTSFARNVERAAEDAAQRLYNISDYRGIRNPKIKGWYEVAKEYVKHGTIDDFIYARYGYAVEECVNLRIAGGSLAPSGGLDAEIQITHGGTRPDIVVKSRSDRSEVAWLDITSERSEDHVLLKSGNWARARLFVAEIMYTPLSVSNIVDTESKDPYAALRWAAEAEAAQARYTEHLICGMNAVFELPEFNEPRTEKVNCSKLAQLTERVFGVALPPHRLIVTHSMLGCYITQLVESNKPVPPQANILMTEFRRKGIHQNGGSAISYVRESFRIYETAKFAAESA